MQEIDQPSTWAKVMNTLQIRNNYKQKPLGLRWRSSTLFIVSTVAIGLFTDHFLYGLIVPIMPFMLEDRVGVPRHGIQRHVDMLLAVYAGAAVIVSPFAGVLADKMASRQTPFLAGLLVILGATILLYIGESIAVLAVARVLQGASGAYVWIVGLALCQETVGPKNLGKTIGSIFSFLSIATLGSPLVGGLLYEKLGYAGVFGIVFGILFIDFLMRILVIEQKFAKLYTQDDCESEVQTEGQSSEPEPSEEDALLGARDEDDVAEFRLPEKLPWLAKHISIVPCLANPRLLTALLAALVQAMLLGAFDVTVPIVARDLFNFNSLKAGMLFLPLALELVFGPVFGWLVDKYGTKPSAVAGYAYITIPLILLRLPHSGGMEQVVLYGGLLGLCGIGLAGIGGPAIVEAGVVVQKYYDAQPEAFGEQGPYAQLYGLNSMVFSLGLAIGPELAGELKQVIGYGNMNAVLAGICILTSSLCFVYLGGRPRISRHKRRLSQE